ncbi:flippase [Lachnospiraceae bacterium C1.1]|nr:flippase [Lachnospiraceae bacterium C1.1]
MMVASLGIPTYGIRACAKVRDDRRALSKTVQELLLINLISTFIVTIAYIICVLSVPRFSQDKILYAINGVNIVLNMFGANWLFQALEQYDYITLRSVVFKFISVILMFLLVHRQADYRIYAAITVFAAVGSNIFNFIRLQRLVDLRTIGRYDLSQHIKPIMILFAQNLTVSVYTNLDSVMLGFMKNDEAVGLYTAAVRVKGILISIVSSLGSVLLPRMSYYVKHKASEKFNRLMILALNAELFMALPLVTYFVFESRDSILFLAGNGYTDAITAMQIILFSIIPIGLTGVIGIQVLTPLNRERQVLYSVMVGAISDFILNIIMIPKGSAAGASMATTIAEFLVLFVQLILARDLLAGVLKKLDLLRYLLTSLLSLLPMIFLARLSVTNSFIRLAMTSIAYFGIYILALCILKDDLLYRLLDNKITGKLLKR